MKTFLDLEVGDKLWVADLRSEFRSFLAIPCIIDDLEYPDVFNKKIMSIRFHYEDYLESESFSVLVFCSLDTSSYKKSSLIYIVDEGVSMVFEYFKEDAKITRFP